MTPLVVLLLKPRVRWYSCGRLSLGFKQAVMEQLREPAIVMTRGLLRGPLRGQVRTPAKGPGICKGAGKAASNVAG